MRSLAVRRVSGTILLAALAATPALAQGVSLAPTIGVYAPTSDLVNSLISGGNTIQFKQKIGLALGGRLGIGLGSRVSLFATGSYVPSKLQATVTQTGVQRDAADNTNLWFGSARLGLWLLPSTSIVAIGLNGGVGVAGRGATTVTASDGNTYTDKSRTDVGGVVGATVGVNLGPIHLFASADDYIYKPKVFEALGATVKTQNDVQVAVGFGVPLGSGGRR